MRIRQVRPEFFTDPVTAHLSAAIQVTYIGLWCVADDAGWFSWDVPQIGALLYPYKSVRVRERAVADAGEALVTAGRLVMYPCGCARVPTLENHQKIGGNKSFPARDRHEKHRESIHSRTSTPGRVGNVSNGKLVAGARGDGAATNEPGLGERLVAAGMKPSLVVAK